MEVSSPSRVAAQYSSPKVGSDRCFIMSDDYLTKSGARDLLTTAIAELLAVRPRMPLSFLAAHFQGSSNKVAATAHILRASHLRSKTSFQDAVMKAYQTLGISSSVQGTGKQPDSAGSGFKAVSSSVGGSATAFPPAAVIRSAKPANGGEAQQRQVAGKIPLLLGTTLDRRDFVKLLEYLCEEFPKHLQKRTFDALQQQEQPQSSSDNTTVSFAKFQRGVEVCLLLEELVDVVEDLFRAIDKSETGEVRASAFLLALEMAAAAPGTQDSHRNSLLTVLKAFVLPSPPPGYSVGDSEDAGSSTMATMTTATAELFNDRTLRLPDMYDAVFHLVFQPVG